MSRDLVDLLGTEPFGARDRAELATEILLTYARVRWLVARRGVPEAIERLRGDVQDAHSPESTHAAALRLAHAVQRTLEPLPADSRCLMRSLVLTGLLARRGVRGEVGIGARPGARFEAHAWVEHEGRALLPTLGYLPLVKL